MKTTNALRIVLPAVLAAACDNNFACPAGTQKQAQRCVRVDAGVATDAAPTAFVQAVCGDGEQSEDEACDDGNGEDGDGCSAQCELEDSACDADLSCSAPEAPVIEGAPSMAPGRELWTWQRAAGATFFEVRLDGEPLAMPPTEPRVTQTLTPGAHTLEVAACNDAGLCSAWSAHHTVSESFGEDAPRALRDSARMPTKTAFGHAVALGCDDCFVSPRGEVLPRAGALAMIERALERGADLVQIDVASIAGTLYAAHADAESAGTRPQLAELFASRNIGSADALLLLDIVENEPRASTALPPEAFAQALFALLDTHPELVRNGRPLWLRSSWSNRAYLQALSEAAHEHAVSGPYVRFIIRDPGAPVADFYAENRPESAEEPSFVQGLPFVDAVALDYRLPALSVRIERARQAGRAVVLENLPGPDVAAPVIAALREQADAILTTFRVDQARAIVADGSADFAFSARDVSADGRVLAIHSSAGSEPSVIEIPLGASVGRGYFTCTPAAGLPSSAAVLAPSLTFSGECGIVAYPERAFFEPLRGSVSSWMGTLSTPSGAAPTQGSLYFGGNLAVTFDANGMVVTFSAASTPASTFTSASTVSEPVLHVPPISPQELCPPKEDVFVGPVERGQPHWWLVEVREGGGRVFLDGKCAAAFQDLSFSPNEAGGSRSLVLGDVRAGLNAQIQQFSSVRWAPPREAEQN